MTAPEISHVAVNSDGGGVFSQRVPYACLQQLVAIDPAGYRHKYGVTHSVPLRSVSAVFHRFPPDEGRCSVLCIISEKVVRFRCNRGARVCGAGALLD